MSNQNFFDRYTNFFFPILDNTFGRVTSLVPFSVGECMIVAGLLWLLCLGLSIVLYLFYKPIRKRARRFFRATLVLVLIIAIVMTLNCFLLYHCTPIEVSLPGYGKTYTVEDLTTLRDYVVTKTNTLSEEMPRDTEGEVLYDPKGTGSNDIAAMKEAVRAASALFGKESAGTSPILFGTAGIAAKARFSNVYNVRPKELFSSDFVSQQMMQGYYFPFSMEANYNSVMKIMNKPYTMAHEICHTHGYIYEDEANFLAFLICTRSNDPILQYSGWLGILNYVNNDFYYAVDKDTYFSHVNVSPTVYQDAEFLTDQEWERIEANKWFETEDVSQAADTFVDTTLKVNGVKSGKISYTHVVSLLLMYFDGSFDAN